MLRSGDPIDCEQGELTLTGSTAFEPVVRTIAEQYESKCQGADIVIEARGSEDGVSQLAELEERSPDDARTVIAFSDGPMGERWDLTEAEVALSFFTLVVHQDIDLGPRGLSPRQVRDIYAGEYRRWGDVVPGRKEIADLPIVLVSRGDESGTRQIFRDRVLKGWERAPSTSLDCRPSTRTVDSVTRCELGSTRAVLNKVEEQPGAIGYSEVGLAKERGARVNTVPLEGDWPNEAQIDLRPAATPTRTSSTPTPSAAPRPALSPPVSWPISTRPSPRGPSGTWATCHV
ncbi:substrate-binding domain-containing protein [Streptomyces sp. NPDC056628]|uniref:substrate-binding domain-containing protein n=1 Tax=Streptomyces sp. NPDC056628 TaxID=3345882 RepID=UPI0036B0F2CD